LDGVNVRAFLASVSPTRAMLRRLSLTVSRKYHSARFLLGRNLRLVRLEEADYVLGVEASGGEVAGNLG